MTDEYVLMDDHMRGTGRDLYHRKSGKLFSPPQGWAVQPQKDQPGGQFAGGRYRGQIYRAATNPERKGLAFQMETDGEYCSLDEVLDGGKTMFDLVNEIYKSGDPGYQYHYAWAHRATENTGDKPEVRQAFEERLAKALEQVPFKFTLLGARRRYLLYFSPGSDRTQTTYLTLAPRPGRESPFNAEGKLSSRYRDHFPPDVVEELKKKGGPVTPVAWNDLSPHPLLYRGPAWSIRFLLDDQDVISGNRIWITDDMNFISSDWCQRHNFSTYGRGMDFHNQEFDLPTWINVALVKKAIRDRVFKPTSAEIKHFAVRDAIKAAKGVEYGAWLKAARDCLLQLEFMGEYEIPTVYGIPFDPLTLTLKAPTSTRITRSDTLRIAATIEAGTQVEWQMAGLSAGIPFTHLFGLPDHVPFHSYKRYDTHALKDEARDRFFEAFRAEVLGYSKQSRDLYGKLDLVSTNIWGRTIELMLYELSTDPRKKAPTARVGDLRVIWESVFGSSTTPAAGRGMPLAGVDERDIVNGRANDTPDEMPQAGVDELDLNVDDDNEDDEGDEEDDEGTPVDAFGEVVAEAGQRRVR